MHEPYDPEIHGTYGNYLRSKNLQIRPGGWTWATKDQVREYRGKDGRLVKETTDQLGNRVIQHGRDQQSVIARPQTVTAHIPNKTTQRSSDGERR